MLRRLEPLTFFFVMMMAIILEGEVVYWIFRHQPVHAAANGSPSFVGEWTGLALPQGWLLGASLVLIYRVTVMFVRPTRWPDNEFLHNRRAFVRLWGWTMALVAMQGLALFLERAAVAS